MAFGGPPLSRSDGSPGDFPPITPENYHSEAKRRRSFHGWPLTTVSTEKLARVGFVYTGERDKVQCFKCKVTYSNWRQQDIPLNVHQKCNPCCPFLQSFTCKRKPPRSEIVMCTNVPPQRRITNIRDNGIACTSTIHQFDRGMKYRSYNSMVTETQSVIRSFPAYSRVDHNSNHDLLFEDDSSVYPSSDRPMIPPMQPSPVHKPPVQSTPTTDHSAILVDNTSIPLCTHYGSAGIYKVRFV